MDVRSSRLKSNINRIKKRALRLVCEHNSSLFGELPQTDNSVHIKSNPRAFALVG